MTSKPKPEKPEKPAKKGATVRPKGWKSVDRVAHVKARRNARWN